MKETTLYEKLRLIRDWQHGLTLMDISIKTGLRVFYLSDFERGKILRPDDMAKLAAGYGVTVTFLETLLDDEYALRTSAGSISHPSQDAQIIVAETETLPKVAKRFLDHRNFVVLDTETTGKDSASPDTEIVEIAIVVHDGTVLLNSFVKPEKPIPAEAMAIHGITDEDCDSAPTFPEIFPRIVECIKDKTVIIYNAGFDATLLENLAGRYGLELCLKDWCLMDAYANFYKAPDKYGRPGRYAWQSLTKACEQQGIVLEDAHRALGDTLATLGLLKALASQEE